MFDDIFTFILKSAPKIKILEYEDSILDLMSESLGLRMAVWDQ